MSPKQKKKRRGKTPRTSCPPRSRPRPEVWRYSAEGATTGVRPRAITGRAAPRARVRARRSRSDATRVCEWCVRSPRAGHASARATRARRPRATRARTAPRTISYLATGRRVVTKREERGERGGGGARGARRRSAPRSPRGRREGTRSLNLTRARAAQRPRFPSRAPPLARSGAQ